MDNKQSSYSFSTEQYKALYFSKGPFNSITIPVIISEVADMLLLTGSTPMLVGKIKLILIECLQNTFLHGLNHLHETASIEIHKGQNDLIIFVENQVCVMKTGSLKNFLDNIKQLTKHEVEELYRKILNDWTFTDKGGAGLGLLTIAKLTDQKINYDFKPNGETASIFRFQILIS
jgi:anti-sigma regulatory factor (Ser/Thr protein kinase)